MTTRISNDHDNPFEALSPLKRGLLLITVVLVISLILLAFAEIALRARMYIKHGSSQGFEVREYNSEYGLLLPRPNIKRGGVVINSEGFRSPELKEKTSRDLRFAFLGGSTTFSTEVTANELTWPAVVTNKIAESNPNIDFEYINAAVIAHNTIDSLRNLKQRVANYDVDVLFIYHGINDIVFDAYHDAVKRGVLSKSQMEPERVPETILQKSVLADLVYKNLLIKFRKNQDVEKPLQIDFNHELTTERFRYRLNKLVEAGRQNSDLVVLPTFTNRLREGQTPQQQADAMTTHLFYVRFYSKDDLLKALSSYNDVIREFSGMEGVTVIDTETAIAGDGENFVDSVHFSDLGSQRFGSFIAKELMESRAIQKIVEATEPNSP